MTDLLLLSVKSTLYHRLSDILIKEFRKPFLKGVSPFSIKDVEKAIRKAAKSKLAKEYAKMQDKVEDNDTYLKNLVKFVIDNKILTELEIFCAKQSSILGVVCGLMSEKHQNQLILLQEKMGNEPSPEMNNMQQNFLIRKGYATEEDFNCLADF